MNNQITNSEKFCSKAIAETPENSMCRIDTSSKEMHKTFREIRLNNNIDDPYNIYINLTSEHKMILIDKIINNDFIYEIHYFQIEFQNQIIFKAYDNFEIGEVLKDTDLAYKLNDFIENRTCIALDKW